MMFASTEIINSWKTSVCEVKRTSSFQFSQGFLCCLCSLWEIEKAFVEAVCSLLFPFRPTPPHDIFLTLLKQPNQVAKHSSFTCLGVWTCNTTAKVGQLLGFSTGVLFSCFSEGTGPSASEGVSLSSSQLQWIYVWPGQCCYSFRHLGVISGFSFGNSFCVQKKKITCLKTAVFSGFSMCPSTYLNFGLEQSTI